MTARKPDQPKQVTTITAWHDAHGKPQVIRRTVDQPEPVDDPARSSSSLVRSIWAHLTGGRP